MLFLCLSTQIILPRVKKSVKCTFQFLQGNVATDWRGGVSFKSSFLPRSFLNLTVNKL